MQWSENQVKKIMAEKAKNGELSAETRELVAACSLYGDENSPDSVLWSREEWLIYGQKAIENVEKILSGEIEPNWDLIKFRAERHFIAGSFSTMREIWQIIINKLGQVFQSECYHSVFHGVNLYDNLKRIKSRNAIKIKNRRIATYFVKKPGQQTAPEEENK